MRDNYRKQTLDALMSTAAQRRGDLPPALKEGMKVPFAEKESGTLAEAITPPRKPRKSCARTRLIKTRLSDSEHRAFCARVKRADLSASEFLRRAALTEQIVIHTSTEWDMTLLDELELLKADVGRVGGLLKMTIRPNEGQRTLHPKEWEELLQIVRQVERTAKRIAELEGRIADGYRQA